MSDPNVGVKEGVGIATDGANSMCREQNSVEPAWGWKSTFDSSKVHVPLLDLLATKLIKTMASALQYMV